MALFNDDMRSATVTATTTLSCLALNRFTFTKLFGPLQARSAPDSFALTPMPRPTAA